MDAFIAAFSPSQPPAPLTFQLPGVAGGLLSEVSAVVRRRTVPMRYPDYLYGRAEVVVELWCPEPRIFGPAQTATVGPPQPQPGFTPPLRFPLRFGPIRPAGAVTVLNTGSTDTDPVVRLTGPIPSPRVMNFTTGQHLALDLNLRADEFLEIDFARRTVLLNGTASRYSSLVSRPSWWTLPPGVPISMGYRSPPHLSPGPTSSMTVTWRPATI
ncbi:phage distal tail protein [Crossiella sp. CA198]|uniref:phage distal tail protein n=1 Tax=Crossiella sp. CA198 TaxID=3455607 RepID=UPI003F8D11C7